MLAAALLAGCGSATPDSGTLTLVIQAADASNPLAAPNVATVYLEIDDAASVSLLSRSFPNGTPIEIDHVPYGAARTFKIETREAGGGVLLAGATAPIDVVKGENLVVTVILQ